MGSKFISQTFVDPTATEANNRVFDVPCDASVYVGAWVRLNASGTALNALADTQSNSNVFGIVEFKPTTTTCNIRVGGVTEEDDGTIMAIHGTLDETKDYFLSAATAGRMTITPPAGTAGYVVVKLGQPFTEDRFKVEVGVRMVRS